MRPVGSAMGKNIAVVAAGLFEGVGEDRQAVEGPVLVHGLGKSSDRGREPTRVESDGAEGVAENVTQEGGLLFAFAQLVFRQELVIDCPPGRIPGKGVSCSDGTS